ncbi:hypothetical protein DFH09DRAFT_951464 [Mycena vulgaris]|nr:hypothetical protein DFH09DRAFT_951464 [Mycena vulgaris]
MHAHSLGLVFTLALAFSATASPVVRSAAGEAPAVYARHHRGGRHRGGRPGRPGKGGHNDNGGQGQGAGTISFPAADATSSVAVVASSSVAAVASSSAAAVVSSSAAAAPAASSAATTLTEVSLDPSVICANFTDDGQSPPIAGQTASSTSTNNYINFCALTLANTPLTNGGQITSGSCNPTPIGLIPSVDKMPSAKFNFPRNGDTINANIAFDASLNVVNFHTGVFTNAQKTYFAAPQTLDGAGLIIGHSHFVIEALTALDQILPTDPTKFVFFKGIDGAAVNGALSVNVAKGVPAGAYRICSINSSSNHQPVIVPIAQHGALDDCAYVGLSLREADGILTRGSRFLVHRQVIW